MNNEEIVKIKEEIQKLIDEVDHTSDVSDEFIELLDEISDELETAKENKKIDNQEELKDKLEALTEIVDRTGTISADTTAGVIAAIQALKLEAPDVEVAAPIVNVQPPDVKVTVPEIKIPEPKAPIVNITNPDTISIKKPTWLSTVLDLKPILEQFDRLLSLFTSFRFPTDAREAISVRLSDGEKFYKSLAGSIGSTTGNAVFRKADNSNSTAVVDDNGYLQTNIKTNESDDYDAIIIEDGNYTYIGYAAPGTSESSPFWKCKRIDETVTGETRIKFANGNNGFTNIGSNIKNLSY